MGFPPLSLYIHIPWCEKKCPYCDFNSFVASEIIPEKQYVDFLISDFRAEVAQVKDRELISIFFGGGTPSLFSAKSYERLLQGVAESFHLSPDIEISLEANPGSAEAEKFAGFSQAGINRLSIGVQSFNDKFLPKLGRIHRGEDSILAFDLALEAGFSNINLDLMYGLPNQNIREALSDLHQALSMNPSHISWYELTVEPNTAFFSNKPILPSEEDCELIQQTGLALLDKNGLNRYEISAFSGPENECSHNLNYWRFGDYLGIGAGAHGKITNEEGLITRYSKSRRPEDYLRRNPQELRINKSTLSKEEVIFEFVLNALRLSEGFTYDQFTSMTLLRPSELEQRVSTLCKKGLISKSNSRIKTTSLGRRYLNQVITEFAPN